MNAFKCIAIVDDDPTSIFLTKHIIKSICGDVIILEFENGKAAFDYIKDENALIPDLMLLDINMPLMNGFELLEELNQIGHYKAKTKVAFLTTSSRSEDKMQAKKWKEVIGFYEKHIDDTKLEQILEALTKRETLVN